MVQRSKIARWTGVLLLLPMVLFAEVYDKREIKPWFSLGGQASFQQTEGINRVIFEAPSRFDKTVLPYFSRFEKWSPIPAGEFGFGVEYGQLMAGFFTNFTLPQTSGRPTDRAIIMHETTENDGSITSYPVEITYRDAKYYLFGMDFQFGWMLASPQSPVNLIPSIRFGFSILNVLLPGDYPKNSEDGKVKDLRLADTYYSSSGRSVNPELEVRIRLSDGVRLGAYGGYRYTLIDQVKIVSDGGTDYYLSGSGNDVDASNYYIGFRFTYVLRSAKEKAQDFAEE